MSKSNGKVTVTGPGLPTLMFLVFLVLKLIGVINWSWWWVTSPLWIALSIVFVICVIAGLVIGHK